MIQNYSQIHDFGRLKMCLSIQNRIHYNVDAELHSTNKRRHVVELHSIDKRSHVSTSRLKYFTQSSYLPKYIQ